jgi:hypothetical protein
MLKQVRPSDKLFDTFHAELLEDLDQLDIPGMVHIGQALCRPFLGKEVCQLRVR